MQTAGTSTGTFSERGYVSEITRVPYESAAALVIALAVVYFVALLVVALENPRPNSRGRHRRVRTEGVR